MKKKSALLFSFVFLISASAFASPWAEKPGYFPKVFGKLGYGLKNTFFGWSEIFIQPTQPKYKTDWEGFCSGAAAAVIYTANGLIHTVTFPIPLDVPDLGKGVHIPPRLIDRSMEHPKLAEMDKAVEKIAKQAPPPQPAATAETPAASPPSAPPPVPTSVSAETPAEAPVK